MAPDDAIGVDGSSISAVIAHGMLNSMAVVTGIMQTLSKHWSEIDDGTRVHLLGRGVEQASLVSALLRDLVLGLPIGATAMLDDLDLEAEARRRARQDDPSPSAHPDESHPGDRAVDR